MKKIFETVNLDQRKTFEQIKSIDKLTNQTSYDFSRTNDILQTFRDNISSMVENVNQEILKSSNDFKLAKLDVNLLIL